MVPNEHDAQRLEYSMPNIDIDDYMPTWEMKIL